jgi:hypothetical protein
MYPLGLPTRYFGKNVPAQWIESALLTSAGPNIAGGFPLSTASRIRRIVSSFHKLPFRYRSGASTCFSDGLSPPARTQFDCLHAGYLPAFHCKSQQGSDDVPSIVAAGAGIHVNESERLVAHDFQDVGVTADEHARAQPTDFLSCPTVIVAGIAAEVRQVAGPSALTILLPRA